MTPGTRRFFPAALSASTAGWVVYRSWTAILDGEEALATGYASSADSTGSMLAAFALTPRITAVGWQHHHRGVHQAASGQTAEQGDGGDCPEVPFSRDWLGECDEHWSSTPHLIVKRTKKLVFVEKDVTTPTRGSGRPTHWIGLSLRPTDRCGRTRPGSGSTPPPTSIGTNLGPPELDVLGLKRGQQGRNQGRLPPPGPAASPRLRGRPREVQGASRRPTSGRWRDDVWPCQGGSARVDRQCGGLEGQVVR